MPIDPVRNAAVDVLIQVFEKGAFLDQAVDRKLRRADLSPRGKRFLAHLAYGTVRNVTLCDHVLREIVKQRLNELPPSILIILRMGVYQALFSSQVTFPAMVHTSVDLAHKRGHAGTARLVNACLRRAPQTIESIKFPDKEKDWAKYHSIRYSTPHWLLERWTAEFGIERAERLCHISNEEADPTLRVNTGRIDSDTLTERLARIGITIEKRTTIPEEMTVTDGANLTDNPVFREGLYVLQDPASMLPAHAVQPKAGQTVLDMCAAPGSKSTHLAQLCEGKLDVTALDLSPRRIRMVVENIERLGMDSIQCVCGDGNAPPFGTQFDAVLVDAPCTGLGTLRRHPDLKLRTASADPARLAKLQAGLLHSAIRLCKNDGVIVYSVCTLTQEETHDICRDIQTRTDVRLEDGPEWFSQWRIGPGQYQTLPSADGVDGFYLMRLRKLS